MPEPLGGYFRGSTVLVSGTAGSGKTSVAAAFFQAACRRGERCLYFAFEESPPQLTRNMSSIGMVLGPWRKQRLLRRESSRPAVHGIETDDPQVPPPMKRILGDLSNRDRTPKGMAVVPAE